MSKLDALRALREKGKPRAISTSPPRDAVAKPRPAKARSAPKPKSRKRGKTPRKVAAGNGSKHTGRPRVFEAKVEPIYKTGPRRIGSGDKTLTELEPWKSMDPPMSRRTWYRRQREAKEREAKEREQQTRQGQ